MPDWSAARVRSRVFELTAVFAVAVAALAVAPAALAGPGPFNFLGPTLNPAPTPSAIAVADLNGDGRPDVALGSPTGEIRVYMQNPSGGEDLLLGMSLPGAVRGVATGDLDHDGHTDIVFANDVGGGGQFTILWGAPPGFTGPLTIPVSSGVPTGVAVADMNSDGLPDVVISADGVNQAQIYRTNPGRFIGSALGYPVPGNPTSIQVANLDGNATPDLLLTSGTTGQVTVMLNDGNAIPGFFITPFGSGGPNPISAAVADFNHDGSNDIAVLNEGGGSGNVQLLRGSPSGVFVPTGGALGVPSGSQSISAGDFDKDGNVDFVVADGTATLQFFQNIGGFLFGGPYIQAGVNAQPRVVVASDITGEGFADVVFGSLNTLGFDEVIGAAPPPPSPPANTVVPVISGTHRVGFMLTTDNGSWTNSPTSFGYQWKRGGTDIAGATSAAYRLTSADAGAQITVTVTATNAGGSAAAVSASSAVASLPANGQLVWSERDTPTGSYEIYQLRPGFDATPLTLGLTGNNTQPTIDPDGSQIAFVNDSGTNPQLWLMGADGSSPHPVTTQVNGVGGPAWSPDGQTIIFTDAAGGSLYTYSVATGTVSTFLVGEAIHWFNPSWSPDGQTIVVTEHRDVDVAISTYDFASKLYTGSLVAGFPADGLFDHPKYSVDGSSVYYDLVTPAPATSLFRVPAAGGAPVQLTDPALASDMQPAPSVDGASIAWVRDGNVDEGPLDFSSAPRIDSTSGVARSPVWGVPPPGAGPVVSFDLTPAATSALVTGEFVFRADQSPVTFECWIDDGGAAPCTRIAGYANLSLGTHTFNVRATSAAGTGDPASYSWTIVAPAAPSAAGSTERASVTSTGGQLSAPSFSPSISGDGNLVAFQSTASEISGGATTQQVYVRNRGLPATTRISSAYTGTLGGANGNSTNPNVARDGSAVVFESLANDLDDLTRTTGSDVFIWTPTSFGRVTRLSPNFSAHHPAISDAAGGTSLGQAVAFDTDATDLGAPAILGGTAVPDTNGQPDIYVWGKGPGSYARVSLANITLAEPNGASTNPAISASGLWVAYQSDASNLVTGDTNGTTDIFLRNTFKPQTLIVSRAFDGQQSNGRSTSPSVSSDGRYVAFLSTATNLVPGGSTGGGTHAFVADRQLHTVFQVDVASNGAALGVRDVVQSAQISADGSKVVLSVAYQSTPSGNLGLPQAYVHDIASGLTTVLTLARSGGGLGSAATVHVAANNDGSVNAFDSQADNLVLNDTNTAIDVFVRTVGGAASGTVSGVTASLTQDSASLEPPTEVRIGDIPVGDLNPNGGSSTSGAPVAQIPVAQIPVAQIPVAQIDLQNAPVAQIPVAQIGLSDPSLNAALATVPITQLPLRPPLTWATILAGTALAALPPQSVSLHDVLSLSPLPAQLQNGATNGLRLEDLDFSHSTLGNVPIVAWALGAVRLSQLPLPGTADATAGWCSALNLTTCPSGLGSQTVLSESIAGAPVAQIPVAQIPVAQIPVAQIPVAQIPVAQIGQRTWVASPVAQIPVAQITLAGSPVAQIPVAQIAVAGSPVAQIPVAQIAAGSAPVAQIPVAQIPVAQIGTIIDCNLVDCATATFGEAFQAGAIKDGATLGMIAPYLTGITLGDIAPAIASSLLGDIPLAAFGTLTVGQLIAILPSTVTLGDIMQMLVGTSAIAWESLPFAKLGVQQFAADGQVGHMHAQFKLDSTGSGTSGAIVTVTLPVGAVYAPGSSSIRTVGAGGSSPVADPVVATAKVPSPDGVPQQTLKWSVDNVNLGDTDVIDFRAFPPLTLGVASSTESAQATSPSTPATDIRPVTVADPETDHPNDAPATAPVLDPNSVYFGYVTAPTDTDYYRIPAPAPGTRIVVRLGHVGTDDDLVVYSPGNSTLRGVSTGQPIDGSPIQDAGIGVNNQNSILAPQVTGDVPIASGLAVAGISDNKGSTADTVAATSTTSTGFYTIQISGYNGATSSDPYTIHIEEIAPATAQPTCNARAFPDPATFPDHLGGVAGTVPSIPANANTLFLFDKKRYGDTYGRAAAQSVQDALNELGGRTALGVSGVVVPVEAYAGVQDAYDAWDAKPCDPTLANAVATAIGGVVDTIRSTHAGLQFLVNVGGDDIVPFFRLPDDTTLTNEAGYTTVFGGNQYFGAAYNSDVLSDDPYATTAPISFLDRQLFVPNLVVSRLVESPADITGTVTQYENAGGQLTPTNAYVAGYDFLADGSHAVATALSHDVSGGVATRIDEFGTTAAAAWTKSQLLADLGLATATSTSASILAPNAHYDHARLLTSKGGAEEIAAPGSAPDPAELASTQDILDALAAAPARLRGRIIFTMGCHAGLPVSDVVVNATQPPSPITPTNPQDWAQTYAGAGAIYVANTGFGIGDTLTVAYSEQLMAQVAQHLDGALRIGEALSRAKQDYFAGLGAVSVYDEKAMNEAELYGLPMWTIGVPQTTVPAAPTGVVASRSLAAAPLLGSLGPDPVTGLNAASFSADPSFTKVTTTRGDYYTNGSSASDINGYQVTHYRPIEPKTSLPLPASNDFRGALILHVTSADETGWHPAVDRPTFDDSDTEPALSFADNSWPSRIAAVTTALSGTNRRQQLELVTGAFFTDTSLPADGQNVQRRWSHLDGQVFYNDTSSDFVPPTLQQTVATAIDATHVAFTVRAYDQSATAGSHGDAKLVYVLYRDSTSNVWKGLFLNQAQAGGPWTGGATVSSATQIEYFVQACDAAGNCSSTTDKARYYSALPPAAGTQQGSQGTVTLSVPPADGSNGYHRSAVVVTATDSASGVLLTSSIDSGEAQPVGADGRITVSGSGVHTVVVNASDGGSAAKSVAIDANDPAIVFATPPDGAVYPIGSAVTTSFRCNDVGSGVQSCTGTQPTGAALDTSSPGFHTFTVTATDIAGRSTSVSHAYEVTWPFGGFFSPVDNLPTLNVVKPGQAVPVKFGLGGNRGLAIFAAGYPAMEPISCSTSAPTDTIEQTVTAGSSSLQYDAGSNQYTYVWKTPSSGWPSGTCRQLILKLVDGTSHVANFKAK